MESCDLAGPADSLLLDPETEADEGKEVDEVLNFLKIFAQVKEHEKLATQVGVGVNKPTEKFMWVKRMYYGDSREKTLAFIETTFKKAFDIVSQALERREALSTLSEEKVTRAHMLARLRNMQRITRLQKSIQTAKDKLFSKLRSTYADDAAVTSRIDILCESIEDKLEEIDASIKFLAKHSAVADDADGAAAMVAAAGVSTVAANSGRRKPVAKPASD